MSARSSTNVKGLMLEHTMLKTMNTSCAFDVAIAFDKVEFRRLQSQSLRSTGQGKQKNNALMKQYSSSKII